MAYDAMLEYYKRREKQMGNRCDAEEGEEVEKILKEYEKRE